MTAVGRVASNWRQAASRLSLSIEGETADGVYKTSTEDGAVFTTVEVDAKEGQTFEIEKIMSIHTSQFADENIEMLALKEVELSPGFDELLEKSTEAWNKIWDEIDIQLEGDRLSQKLLRLHNYHLMVSASHFNVDLDASVTARGLHGEAYRGHIFWDELFILPFYNVHFPDVARSLLMYRYRRLQKAREYAKEYSYKGAMFPWQSGSDGEKKLRWSI